MNVSARNVFKGKITGLIEGAVNAGVELTTASGDPIVTIVTEGSVKSLGLAVGKEAVAYVKAPWVTRVVKGQVNAEVGIELGLQPGVSA